MSHAPPNPPRGQKRKACCGQSLVAWHLVTCPESCDRCGMTREPGGDLCEYHREKAAKTPA